MQNTGDNQREITRRELFKMASPLGRVTMTGNTCTACGLCVIECVTEALTLEKGDCDTNCRLLFRHGLCTACGKCIEVCPEQCLHLERTLEPDRLNGPAELLFEDEFVKCRECGTPFAPRSMIDGMRARTGIPGRQDTGYMETCPDCKAKIRLAGIKR